MFLLLAFDKRQTWLKQPNVYLSESKKSNESIVFRIRPEKPKFAAYTMSRYAEVLATKDLVSAA